MTNTLSTEFSDFSPSDAALFDVMDLLLNGLTEDVFAIGDTAKSIHDHNTWALEGPIELAIQLRDLSPSLIQDFKTRLQDLLAIPFEFDEKTGFTFKMNDVDVSIRIIRKNYDVFRFREAVVFKVTSITLPNPFDKYWKTRNFIK